VQDKFQEKGAFLASSAPAGPPLRKKKEKGLVGLLVEKGKLAPARQPAHKGISSIGKKIPLHPFFTGRETGQGLVAGKKGEWGFLNENSKKKKPRISVSWKQS